jgi:hypothetical protein
VKRKDAKMRKSGKVLVMAAVAAISVVPYADLYADWSSAVYTDLQDGVTWQFKIDTTNKRALLGAGIDSGSDAESNWGTTSKASLPSVANFPISFTVNDVEYTLASIGNRAFIRYSMSDMTIPISISGSFFRIYDYAFYECTNLENIWLKGPSSGHATLLAFGTAFGKCSALKYILVSPSIIKHNDYNLQLTGSSGATIVAPFCSDNTTWVENVIGGTDNRMLFYSELDETAKTITFAPTNAVTLEAAFNAAVPIKNRFGLSTVISITNRIDEEIIIPEEAVPYTSFELHSWVTFKVATQAQLESTLAAISPASPVIIDPTGAKEMLTVPPGRTVFVKCDEGDSIIKKTAGLRIKFL